MPCAFMCNKLPFLIANVKQPSTVHENFFMFFFTTKNTKERLKIPCSKLQGIFDCKEFCQFFDSLANPAASAGNALAVAVQVKPGPTHANVLLTRIQRYLCLK